MTVNKKILLPALAAALVSGAVSAQAQVQAADDQTSPENVLFKIHDVQAVKDTDGLINACDYSITFYNRSPRQLRSAMLNLGWMDNSVATLISQEKNEEKKKTGRSSSKTEEVDAAALSTSIDVPTLEAYKQVTLRSRLQSDKCFLMLGDVKFVVKSCNIADETGANVRNMVRNRNGSACDGLFEFISASNPEYYREFKPVSYEEDVRQGDKERMAARREISAKYDEVVAEINSISATLDDIKAEGYSDTPRTAVNVENNNLKNEISDAELSAKLKTLFPGLGEAAAPAVKQNQDAPVAAKEKTENTANKAEVKTISAPTAEEGAAVAAGATLKDTLNDAAKGSSENANNGAAESGGKEKGTSGTPSSGPTEYDSPNVQ